MQQRDRAGVLRSSGDKPHVIGIHRAAVQQGLVAIERKFSGLGGTLVKRFATDRNALELEAISHHLFRSAVRK